MIVTPGATSVSVQVQIVDDTGLAVTGLVAATFPSTYYSRAGETLPSAITLSDLASQNSAYSSGGVKELAGGYYRLDVPNAAFATASRVRLFGEASGKHLLYPPIVCDEVPANVRQLLGTTWLTPGTAGTPDVNVKLISGDATAADNAESFFDGTGYAGTNNVIPTVTTLTNLPTIPANWLTAAGLAADAVAEIQSGLSTLDAAGVRTAVGMASANLDTQIGTLATAANLATVAGYLDTEIAAIQTAVVTTIPAALTVIDDFLDTEVAAIKAKTDNLPAAPAAVGDIPTAAANAAAVLAAGDVDGYTLEQTLKLCLAALAGKLSGAATTTVTIRAADDSKARITATVDSNGNRSAITYDAAG